MRSTSHRNVYHISARLALEWALNGCRFEVIRALRNTVLVRVL
jgi:hypothetical protein